MNGIINVYKEKGFTSHDVVAKLRGILKQKKIGHTGTLDPNAEGVLPVCVGNATKVCDLITDRDKAYRTVLLLGQTSDTQDVWGNILGRCDVCVTEDEVRDAIESFVGEYDQIPPMYSAIKIGGKKLYELARKGQEIERPARHVMIREIKIISIDLPEVTMEVSCSKGTYIRTLCHDIGGKLCCGGLMKELTRIRSGEFVIADSKKLSEIEERSRSGQVDDILLPTDSVFKGLPEVHADGGSEKLLRNGNPIPADHVTSDIRRITGNVRMYDQDGAFIGVYEYKAGTGVFKPVKLFL